MNPTKTAALIICCLLTACGPKPVDMAVSYFKSGVWESGEIKKDCAQIHFRGDPLLQCDAEDFTNELLVADKLTEPERTLRTNRLHSLWDNAKTFHVRFHGEDGHSQKWTCTKNSDVIDCR